MHRSKTRVYVIDASDDLRRVLADVLAEAGLEAVSFADPSAAVDAARVHPPDVIVLEVATHEDSQFLSHIREMGHREIRVIAMTVSELDGARAAPFDGVLAKPFDVAQLLTAVRSATASSPPASERR